MTDVLPAPAATPIYEESPSVAASIIVVNHNGGDHVSRCLDALARDPASGRYELIVVDNASDDGSAAAIAVGYPRVKLLRSEKNLGFGAANNLGAAHARGPFLAFLNPDTIVQPGWLQSLIGALQKNPQVGLATPKILLIDDPRRINAAGNQVHLTGLTLCRGLGRAAHSLSRPADVGAVSGAAFAMRRDLFMALGGFDASFFMYFEDTDLSLRARLAGARCLYVPEAIVYHDYRLRFGPLKTYYEERNRYITLLKLYRWPTLLLLLPSLLLGEVVSWGFTLLRDRARWTNKLRAYAHVVRHRHQILARRRRAQATRRVPDRALLQATVAHLEFEQTGDGFVARAAHLLFNPLFYLQRKLLGALLPW